MNTTNDRDDTIRIIKTELRRRSGKTWSVKGGRGTAWGWITITAPPVRCNKFGSMTESDSAELSELLGENVGHQGASIPDSQAHRIEYVDHARGRAVAAPAVRYWD